MASLELQTARYVALVKYENACKNKPDLVAGIKFDKTDSDSIFDALWCIELLLDMERGQDPNPVPREKRIAQLNRFMQAGVDL